MHSKYFYVRYSFCHDDYDVDEIHAQFLPKYASGVKSNVIDCRGHPSFNYHCVWEEGRMTDVYGHVSIVICAKDMDSFDTWMSNVELGNYMFGDSIPRSHKFMTEEIRKNLPPADPSSYECCETVELEGKPENLSIFYI